MNPRGKDTSYYWSHAACHRLQGTGSAVVRKEEEHEQQQGEEEEKEEEDEEEITITMRSKARARARASNARNATHKTNTVKNTKKNRTNLFEKSEIGRHPTTECGTHRLQFRSEKPGAAGISDPGLGAPWTVTRCQRYY